MLLKVVRTRSSSCSISSRSTRNASYVTVFDCLILEQRSGILIFQVLGPKAAELFQTEPGGHRWQRIPPTEKRGRVQSSTITVAVLPEPTHAQIQIRDQDLEFQACRGSGAGGQNRNVTNSAVQITHKPTGLMVRCETERSQHQNHATALSLLRARLWEAEQNRVIGTRAQDRKQQVGQGQRGDKRRTVRYQDGIVTDHVLGRTWKLREYLKGDW